MITGTFNKIPRKKNSHGYGWARTWAENLDLDINHAGEVVDVVYQDHGVNFGGSLNLFGGFTAEISDRVHNFLEAKQVYSLDRPMPDYGAMLKKRGDVEDKDWCDKVSAKCAEAETLLSTDLDFDWLTIGDSHTAAYAPHNSCVIKTDGLTLNGQLRSDFEYVKEYLAHRKFKGITMSFGNIDVRHHICRLDADWRELYREWKKFGDSLGIEVEYSTPWPIEFEGRRLPKTGYYKDQPFWGSREERSQLVQDIISFMDETGMKRVEYPEEWFNMDPEAFAKEKMESVSSVHMSPEIYRRQDWGKTENTLEGFFG